jgi:ABC-type multidrug transport system ATPase subunit
MQTYELVLKSDVSKTFRCQKAADSLDIDVEKKSIHKFKVEADLTTDFNIGVVVGASGSGKTTFIQHIFGKDCFIELLDEEKPIIDQFPEKYSYEDCASMLSGIGLTSVPCWIRPVKTLSNGQKARAYAALAMSKDADVILIDEWTSVVDRTVAKVMSYCLQKHARKHNKKIIVCSCHYDVIEWLNPDLIVDCNQQIYTDRRSLWQNSQRAENIEFNIREIDRKTWPYFSKYHYLSDRLPGGKLYLFGLFHGSNQIGFQCFANYVPKKKTQKEWIYHSNRTVIHPDYAGLGLGIKLINETSEIMHNKPNIKVMAKFSSTPIYRSMIKQDCWQLKEVQRNVKISKMGGGVLKRGVKQGFRHKVKTYSFEYKGVK